MTDNTFLVNMGERITLRRKELKITQEQFAEQVTVSLQTISNIECGRKAARPENLAKICIALNVSADYVLLGERSESQVKGAVTKLAKLPEEKYQAVNKIIELLQKDS